MSVYLFFVLRSWNGHKIVIVSVRVFKIIWLVLCGHFNWLQKWYIVLVPTSNYDLAFNGMPWTIFNICVQCIRFTTRPIIKVTVSISVPTNIWTIFLTSSFHSMMTGHANYLNVGDYIEFVQYMELKFKTYNMTTHKWRPCVQLGVQLSTKQ